MDPYSSGEETVIKTRKPYTITKQRERWTEEEHNRFLEALKLHGRAWQRIEEHIGTKTAVQIRSHAQKFFTKLEKEAHVKGVPVRQALDIEIPPPRPKRKPSNPYPRKISAGSSSLQLAVRDGKSVTSLSSLHCFKDILDREKEPIPEKSGGDGKIENVNKGQDEENCTEPFSFLQDASSASLSLANNIYTSKSTAAINSCPFREFVPVLGEVNNQDQANESYITIEPRKNQNLDKHDKDQAFQDNAASNTSKFGNCHPLHGHLAQDHNPDKQPTQPGNFGAFSIKDMQAAQNYPRHVPVLIVDGSLGGCAQNISSEITYQEHELQQMEKGIGQTNLVEHQPTFTATEHHSNASRLSSDQIFPTFHPLLTTPVRGNQDDYASLFNISSSTFSSFIVSALLQNPSAHAAACFAAAKYWPCANMEASSSVEDSVVTGGGGGIPLSLGGQSALSIAAIAAATVAAATSWWAAQGLLPTFHQGLTCPPPPPPSVLTTPIDNSQPRAANTGTATPGFVFLQETNIDVNTKVVSLKQQPASKSPPLALSKDLEGSRDRKLNTGSGATDAEKASEPALLDSSKAKNRKQVDRSSCGSNTPSSSDIETDALEKNEKAKEELKEADASPSSDSSSCGSRSYICLNDSWKEVSEEGRLAFKALFSREVLPQSFSPPQDLTSEVQQKSSNTEEHQKNASASSHFDLNRQLWIPVESTYMRGGDQNQKQNGEGRMLSVGGLGGQVKLKVHRTGFKPYKRCTAEAKESRMMASKNDEKGPKRMRLGGEAPT